MLKKFCKLNYKYDNLPEPKRTLFFFLCLMPIICFSQLIFIHLVGDTKGYLSWAILMLALVGIRMSPTIYFLINKKDYDEEVK
jgi:uncharacterized protein YybS (DUF2232 family)